MTDRHCGYTVVLDKDIREDAPLSVKMALTPEQVALLVDRIAQTLFPK